MAGYATEGTTQLFDAEGRRKYLAGGEWRRFLAAADRLDAPSRTFCYVLAFTGCRISEGLGLTPQRLDVETGHVVFLTLKRRARVFRAVPIPPDLMTALSRLARGKPYDEPLWGWCRVTAWRRVKKAMTGAGITGPQATARGLRHAFGVSSAEKNVPPGLAQRWMGHARLESTAIYMNAVGQEERAFAKRMWRR